MEFFAKALGWTYYEMPPYGHGVQAGGRDIGGLFDLNGGGCPPGLPPVIGVMVKVDNADATGGCFGRFGERHEARVRHRETMAGWRSATTTQRRAFDIWEPKGPSPAPTPTARSPLLPAGPSR